MLFHLSILLLARVLRECVCCDSSIYTPISCEDRDTCKKNCIYRKYKRVARRFVAVVLQMQNSVFPTFQPILEETEAVCLCHVSVGEMALGSHQLQLVLN